MESKLEITDGIGELLLVGSLTIEQAEDLKALLLQALHDTESLTIDLAQITRADLSCLQLLNSISTNYQGLNKALTWQGKDSQVIKQVMAEAGYSCLGTCSLDHD
ncbi:MAG: STAS domain-containing protein [Thermodesulfobacteriota bacterium]